MRMSDWSSDVCTSDLIDIALVLIAQQAEIGHRGDRHDRVEERRIEHVRLERRIATVGPSDDRQLGGIGDTLLHEPPAGVIHIPDRGLPRMPGIRSEEHTSELQSLMRISYAVFCLK